MSNRPIELKALIRADTDLKIEQVQKFFTQTPAEKVKRRPAKGGGEWSYVAGSYVTQVLNSLFGFDWNFTITTSMDEALKTASTGTIVVQGRLEVRVGDRYVIKEQYGRKEVAYKKGTTDLLDFGNDMKAAATDAKKKCASELGLFADIYSQEDFFEAKVVDEIEPDESDVLLDKFKKAETQEEITELLKGLDPQRRRAFTPVAENRLKELRDANAS